MVKIVNNVNLVVSRSHVHYGKAELLTTEN